MGIDRLDGDETRPLTAHDNTPDLPNGKELRPQHELDADELRRRAEYYVEYRATVDAEYRAAAVDRGCDRVRETEQNLITPEMRRIEAEDPDRHLVGFEFRCKDKDRLTEKVTNWMRAQPDLTPDEAFRLVKDAIRYTFEYTDDNYAAGVHADCDRLEAAGFERVDRNNSWTDAEYKGINSRWREPESGFLFEVQFHTQASFEAKQLTHSAYERIRDTSTPPPPSEVRELRSYQREVSAKTPIPPGAEDIPNYP
jgi:hypothetical protein